MVLVFFVVDLVVFFVVVVFGFFFLNLKLILLFGCFMRNVLKLWLVCDDLKFGSRFVWLLVSSLFICLCVIFCCRIILFEWKLQVFGFVIECLYMQFILCLNMWFLYFGYVLIGFCVEKLGVLFFLLFWFWLKLNLSLQFFVLLLKDSLRIVENGCFILLWNLDSGLIFFFCSSFLIFGILNCWLFGIFEIEKLYFVYVKWWQFFFIWLLQFGYGVLSVVQLLGIVLELYFFVCLMICCVMWVIFCMNVLWLRLLCFICDSLYFYLLVSLGVVSFFMLRLCSSVISWNVFVVGISLWFLCSRYFLLSRFLMIVVCVVGVLRFFVVIVLCNLLFLISLLVFFIVDSSVVFEQCVGGLVMSVMVVILFVFIFLFFCIGMRFVFVFLVLWLYICSQFGLMSILFLVLK